jgi:hypothetical protein
LGNVNSGKSGKAEICPVGVFTATGIAFFLAAFGGKLAFDVNGLGVPSSSGGSKGKALGLGHLFHSFVLTGSAGKSKVQTNASEVKKFEMHTQGFEM